MNVTQGLSQATNYLESEGITDARSSARFLLAHVLNLDPSRLLFHQQELSNVQEKAFQILLDRRAKREPVAYILAETEFCGLKLKINPSVLIPRPETEQLVELVIKSLLATDYRQPTTIIEVGTGSGAIGLALTSKLNDVEIVAMDISKNALSLAQQNAKMLKLESHITFAKADLLISHNSRFTIPDPSIIVANLPYIPTGRIKKLAPDVRDFEPHLALDGGPDGLDCYRKLFNQIDRLSTKPQAIFCEIDETHGKLIKELAHSRWPKAKVTIEKDLAGLDRFAIVNL